MTDEELIARLRASGRHPMMDNNCKVDVFLINDAADRIEALTAKVKLMDDLDAINGEKIEALGDKLAKAVEALEYYNVAGHEGKEARATLAEIKGESHE